MWLDRVKRTYGDDLDITWKAFSLEQANNKEGHGWKVWEQPDKYPARSLLALRAGEAARLQGQKLFSRFHLTLLSERHGENSRIPLNELGPLVDVARKVGLDLPKFQYDLSNRSLLKNIAMDHTEAVEKHGIFGTPTFLFKNGGSAYLKTFIPPENESLSFFRHFVGIMSTMSYVGEIKRPQPPWPRGAI